MQGIKDEGYPMSVELNVRIVDIEKPSKVSDSQIEELVRHYTDIHEKLYNILEAYKSNEFKYESESHAVYYWIPVQYAF